MSTAIANTFQGADVRHVIVADEPVWIGKDVCDAVGISKYRDALAQLDADERVSVAVDTLGGAQQMTAVTEAGIWSLMMLSRSPLVKPFKRWLTHEVLPAIRRTGGYSSAPALSGPELMAAALVEAQQTLAAKDSTIAQLAPKAAYVNEFVADEDLILFRTVANQLVVKESSLREVLIERNWIYKTTGTRWSNSKGRKEEIHQYRAYADKKEYFRLRAKHDAPRINGEVQQTLMVTPPGAEAIARNLARWTEEAA